MFPPGMLDFLRFCKVRVRSSALVTFCDESLCFVVPYKVPMSRLPELFFGSLKSSAGRPSPSLTVDTVAPVGQRTLIGGPPGIYTQL